jgi:CarD-like/TRCF domain
VHESMKADIELEVPACIFEVGDNVVYPQHGAVIVVNGETKDLLGKNRDYLTIQILHNSSENAQTAGLRRVIDGTYQTPYRIEGRRTGRAFARATQSESSLTFKVVSGPG